VTIRTRIGLMILAFAGDLGLLAALSIWAGSAVQVNGPAYQRIVGQKLSTLLKASIVAAETDARDAAAAPRG